MAYDLLRKIIDSRLPMTVDEEFDVEKLRILRDAGYVIAQIPPAGRPGESVPALITAITPLGRVAMSYFGNYSALARQVDR
jgi:hypothetical protein